MGWLLQRRETAETPHRLRRLHTPQQVRALRAAGARLDLADRRASSSAVTRYRQPWQEDALDYVETVGELRFAHKLIGNTAKKARFFAAAYVTGEDAPVPIEDSDLAQYAGIANEALDRLGGPEAVAELVAATVEAFKAPGEAYLVGRADRGDGVEREVWEIRSISEVGTVDERVVLRDAPSSRQAGNRRDGEPLGPDDFIARLWTPSRRYRMLADSPVRAAIDTCLEALVLLSKEVSATASSRLVSAGLLLLDDRLMIARDDGPEGADSAEDDPLLSALIESGTAAKRDPGSAEAAFPILMRGPADAIKESKHLTFARPAVDFAADRDWLLRRLATVIDLPSEMLLGTPANHWTGFLIDDTKWRDYVEPGVQDVSHSWTVAYYRPYLLAAGVPPDAAARMAIWDDPTRAVVKSNRTQSAGEARDRAELSGAAYREHLGFREDEAPDQDELLKMAAMKGLLDPAATLAILQGKPPPEPAPPVEPAPEAEAEPEAEPPAAEGPPNGGVPPSAPAGDTDDVPDAAAMRRVLAARLRQVPAIAPAALVAATTVTDGEALAISQRLTAIDTQLRERVRAACEAAVKRALERAGSKLVSKLSRAKDGVTAAAVRDVPAWAVPHRLGPTLTAALGLDEATLLDSVLGELEVLWHRYVDAGSKQALRQAARLLGMDVNEAFAVLDGRFRTDRAAGWAFLRERLAEVAAAALVADPAEAVAAAALVSPSVSRAALAVAGGFITPTSRGIDARTLLPLDPREHFGGIGTGTTLKRFMEERGARVELYEWIYGFSERAFEPHLDLDRKRFSSWDDDTLRSPESAEFVGTHLRPGDHRGCQCDFLLVWAPPPAKEGTTS